MKYMSVKSMKTNEECLPYFYWQSPKTKKIFTTEDS